jgi:hypothetical protein
MNDLGSLFPGLDHPLKADRVILGHVRAHDENRIRIQQILRRGGRPAPSISGAQTGHRRAMSNPGLVADTYHSQAPGKQFLDKVILFVVEGCSSQMGDRCRLH